ncbi:hypothetical protein [Streptacidiphilus anmyonensis]|uniref:hypothetical protein n=1 Tax=Streptacidiphilus anmyonensis TaxID=405782 RepID=UPI0005A6A06E|nr:hypothetical protein [Streptacidiphilus anmyonensis]
MSTLNDLLAEIDTWPEPIDRNAVREVVQRAWGIAIGHGQYSPRLVDDEDDVEPHGLEGRVFGLRRHCAARGFPTVRSLRSRLPPPVFVPWYRRRMEGRVSDRACAGPRNPLLVWSAHMAAGTDGQAA